MDADAKTLELERRVRRLEDAVFLVRPHSSRELPAWPDENVWLRPCGSCNGAGCAVCGLSGHVRWEPPPPSGPPQSDDFGSPPREDVSWWRRLWGAI
jgi:hypothetical protein